MALAFGCGLIAWGAPIALDLRNDAFLVGLAATTFAVGAVAASRFAIRSRARAAARGAALALGGVALVWIALFVLLMLLPGDLEMS